MFLLVTGSSRLLTKSRATAIRRKQSSAGATFARPRCCTLLLYALRTVSNYASELWSYGEQFRQPALSGHVLRRLALSVGVVTCLVTGFPGPP